MVDPPQKHTRRRRQVRLQDRDAEILRDHVACFRLTTYEALHRVYWPSGKLHAAKSWVRRMHDAGLLAEAPLYARKNYYHATAHAARLLNLDPAAVGPRKPAYLATVFGHFAYCCLGETLHRKLAPTDLKAEFPELVLPRHANDGYYVDRTMHLHDSVPERARLGLIFVDDARSLRRIPAVLNRLISQRLRIPAWKSGLIRNRSFVISIVTTTDGKRDAIRSALDGLHRDVLFRVECCPELRNVVHERSTRYAAQR